MFRELNNNWMKIIWKDNSIRDEGATKIGEGLKENTTLTMLDLSGDESDDRYLNDKRICFK